MSHQFAEIMFTDGVKAAQEQNGSRARLERFAENSGPNDELTEREAGFIAQRDTFYMATVNMISASWTQGTSLWRRTDRKSPT